MQKIIEVMNHPDFLFCGFFLREGIGDSFLVIKKENKILSLFQGKNTRPPWDRLQILSSLVFFYVFFQHLS